MERTRVGTVAAIYRYPVKSMAGERLASADLGWHGVAGDRRFALRRLEERGGFPWLTASRLPELIRYVPVRAATEPESDLPTHVRTPGGDELPLRGPDLTADITRRVGAPVEMMYLDRGIFDEASVSVIASATVDAIAALSAQPADVRRFRPNILVDLDRVAPFAEDEWVGGTLTFGDAPDGAIVAVTNVDERCVMVNLDPESARSTPEVLKAIVRERDNRAGIYGSVFRRGRIAVAQPVFFERRS
ncbi:MAG: MOSC domain-containing protein [Vicinamibacterales bacterium]